MLPDPMPDASCDANNMSKTNSAILLAILSTPNFALAQVLTHGDATGQLELSISLHDQSKSESIAIVPPEKHFEISANLNESAGGFDETATGRASATIEEQSQSLHLSTDLDLKIFAGAGDVSGSIELNKPFSIHAPTSYTLDWRVHTGTELGGSKFDLVRIDPTGNDIVLISEAGSDFSLGESGLREGTENGFLPVGEYQFMTSVTATGGVGIGLDGGFGRVDLTLSVPEPSSLVLVLLGAFTLMRSKLVVSAASCRR